eukprot:jgi/Bigna1/136603/aug1.34_g11311
MRNDRLLKEMVVPNHKFRLMSEADQQKRAYSMGDIQRKLLDTSRHLSDTRLIIRNLPRSMDTKGLKALCVVLMDQNKLDDNGRARSRGVGFVEFDGYADTVACLRCLNNHPNAGHGFSFTSRPIVEFAVEDSRKVARRRRRVAERRARIEAVRQVRKEAKNPGTLQERIERRPEALFEEMQEDMLRDRE